MWLVPTQTVSTWNCCVKQSVLLLAFVVLSGCATYHSQPIAPAALIQAFEARTLDNPDLQRYVALHIKTAANSRAPNAWDLTTLTLAAFYFSPELDVARAKAATDPLAPCACWSWRRYEFAWAVIFQTRS